MKSLKSLYKIGYGPSSSHTMGPNECAKYILKKYENANNFKVVLYGSLALTGKGHLTDYILEKSFYPYKCEIIFDYQSSMKHPNTLTISAYENNVLVGGNTFYSVGGGSIVVEGEITKQEIDIYEINSFDETYQYLQTNNLDIVDYIVSKETNDIYNYIEQIKQIMLNAIERGLDTDGVLPGPLKVIRKAKKIYEKSNTIQEKIFAYAYAVNEENASGGLIVTAPTCGASGVLPSLLKSVIDEKKYTSEEINNALLVAGFIGNLVKQNASISGAEAGCQAEVGTACSMGAAFIAYLLSKDLKVVEQAAEMALEHNLGLTCDPIMGYVQIPCIERNAVAAKTAYDCAILSNILGEGTNKITFDMVCKTMIETGQDINESYRETSIGGLAKNYGGSNEKE